MATSAVLVSRAEYDARTAAGERLEFDEGHILEMPNNTAEHDWIKWTIARQINRQLDDPGIAGCEGAFEVSPDKVRHPDVAVCLKRPRLSSDERLQGAPDLAIEVVSQNDTAVELDARIRLFLENGARAVWIVFPEARRVDIHQAGQPTRHYGAGEVITNEEPIPHVRIQVASLFQ